MGTDPDLSGLYAITPDMTDTPALCVRVAAALRGGARLVQYRNKEAQAGLRKEQAAAILALCRGFGVPLIINDDLDLAKSLDADGVHLGREDAPAGLAAARKTLGPNKLLGVSCYDEMDRAREAAAIGADYVAFGALFPSPTKPGARRAPLDLFTRAKAEIGCRICGIGGITLENAPLAVSAGADLLAVITDLFEAPDIESRAREYSRFFPG